MPKSGKEMIKINLHFKNRYEKCEPYPIELTIYIPRTDVFVFVIKMKGYDFFV